MSGDAAHHVFSSIWGLGSHDSVYNLLQGELPHILGRCTRRNQDNDCLLAEVGDFLVTVMEITAELAQVLVQGGHVTHYISNCGLLDDKTLATTEYLDDQHDILKWVLDPRPDMGFIDAPLSLSCSCSSY